MRVAIVVDPSSPQLDELSRQMAVWAVESPDNRTSAKRLWAEVPKRDLTLYKVQDLNDRVFNSSAIINTVELHHPQITSLVIVGVTGTESLRAGLADAGYAMAMEGGQLVAHRDPSKPLPY